MLRQTSAVTGVTRYEYDLAGNLTRTIDARGAVTSRDYDVLGRVSESVTTEGGASETVTWGYDSGALGTGRMTSMTDPLGSVSHGYERRGLLASERRSIDGSEFTTGYGYDRDGNRVSLAYPSGRVVAYTYDYAGRPVSATSGDVTFVASATYEPFGPMKTLAFGNGTTKSMAHDNRYLITANQLAGPGGALASYAYAYDSAGNITGIADALDPGYSREFGYDDLNRLVVANSGAKLWGAGSYRYDAMGNLLESRLGAEVTGFEYQGSTPKLASVTENGATRSVSYDAAGNEAVTGGAAFQYTPRNSLASGDGLSYRYDGRGIRAITELTNLGRVTGTVINGTDGLPLAGVVVRAGGASVRSGTDGTFELITQAGSITLTLESPGFLPVAQSVPIPGGSSIDTGTIVLELIPGVVTGAVTDENAMPVAGATVILTGALTGTTTDDAGGFTLHAAPGTHTVTVSKDRYRTAESEAFTLASGDLLPLGAIVLHPAPATITGSVRNTTGAVVPGASLSVTGTAAGSVTDAEGNFVVEHPAGTLSLTITAAGYETFVTAAFAVGAGETHDAGAITLQPLVATITGSVMDSVTSEPRSGADVVLSSGLSGTTDASGRFTLTSEGGTLTITVSLAGYATTTTPAFTVAPGGVHDSGVLAIDPYGAITGRVTDLYDGTPVAGAAVIATSSSAEAAAAPWPKFSTSAQSTRSTSSESSRSTAPAASALSSSTITGADGNFTLPLAPGSWTLTIRLTGYNDAAAGPYTVAPGQTVALPDDALTLQPEGPVPALLVYTGALVGTYGEPIELSARLTDQVTLEPLAGRSVTFQFGEETRTATTAANGAATVSVIADVLPGAVPVELRYAGEAGYRPAEASGTVRIARATPNLYYSGKPALAQELSQVVRATMHDAHGGPLEGKLVSFALGSVTATGITDAGGYVASAVTLPASLNGGRSLVVTFAGDDYYEGVGEIAPVTVYQRSQFVVWGGNAAGPRIGERMNFWGGKWNEQVTGGDDQVNRPFLGWAVVPAGPLALCQTMVRTGSSPALDEGCWHSKGGNVSPPDALPEYIQVIVTTSMAMEKGTTFGNTAATAVLRVEPGYAPGHNTPGYGTIVAVADDGEGLFPHLAYTGPASFVAGASSAVRARVVDPVTRVPLAGMTVGFALAGSVAGGETNPRGDAIASLPVPADAPVGAATLVVTLAGDGTTAPAMQLAVPVTVQSVSGAAAGGKAAARLASSEPVTFFRPRRIPLSLSVDAHVVGGAVAEESGTLRGRRYSFYSPELSLLAESDQASTAIAHEYIWFAGMPVAQVSDGGTRWTFTDHLGTPLLQTDASGNVVWRAEHEPYGTIVELRVGEGRHQPLRFPGQEAEQIDGESNGVTERSYNIFRWYRSGWGKYTQADPIGLRGGRNLFGYVAANPIKYADPRGLVKWDCTLGFGHVNAEVGPGAGALFGTCRSCQNGKGVNVEFISTLVGGSVGPIPFGIDFGSVTLEDGKATPSADSLRGPIFIGGVGIAGGPGYGCSQVVIGDAKGEVGCSGNWWAGLDLGLDWYAGYSLIIGTDDLSCCK